MAGIKLEGMKQATRKSNQIKQRLKILLSDPVASSILAVLRHPKHTSNSLEPLYLVFRPLEVKEEDDFKRRNKKLMEELNAYVLEDLPKIEQRKIGMNHKVVYQRKEFDDISYILFHDEDIGYFIHKKEVFGIESLSEEEKEVLNECLS